MIRKNGKFKGKGKKESFTFFRSKKQTDIKSDISNFNPTYCDAPSETLVESSSSERYSILVTPDDTVPTVYFR